MKEAIGGSDLARQGETSVAGVRLWRGGANFDLSEAARSVYSVSYVPARRYPTRCPRPAAPRR
jgi:hypothetical protein